MALSLTLAACAGGDDAQVPSATVGTAPTTTSTTAQAVDVAAIPDDQADIDEAYVQAVVDALFAVDAQATKIFVETKELDEEAIKILGAIYTPDELDRQVNAWFQDLAQRSDQLLVGTLINDVVRIIDSADDCLYLEVESDYSEVTTRIVSRQNNYLGLTPKIEGDDPEGRNPTAWMMFMDGVDPGGLQPEGNPCTGR